MKQLSLIALLLCLFTGAAKAATVSGTVTNASTSTVVANQRIYIFDSLMYYVDSTLTNSSGVYSFTIPSTVPSGDLLMVTTNGCGASNMNTHFWAGSNITSNFSICAAASTYTLHGTVTLGGAANTGVAKVYLIRQDYDSVLMDTVLTAIDSMTTAPTGGAYSKGYSAIPSGRLLLKAALVPTHPSYSSYLPTYYTSSLTWSGATALTNVRFNAANTTNINLTAGTNTGGPGFIGGSVLLGANKGTAIGDPLSNRILLLTTSTGQAVAYKYSDAAGKFSFSNLPYGTYKLFGDAWGKTNPVLTVTLSPSNATVNNVIFEENSSKFEGHIGNLSVGGQSPLQSVKVYPNPANDYVSLNGLSTISGNKTVTVRNITGAVISSVEVKAGANASIPTSSLPAGMYMLQLQTAEGAASYKFIKE